jgi:hypothetical protein
VGGGRGEEVWREGTEREEVWREGESKSEVRGTEERDRERER